MLFKPSFCCNCGEKIERAEWKLWTSRRFCELCATEFTLQDHAVKGVMIFATVISVFGLASLFTGSNRPNLVASKAVERPQNAIVGKGANILAAQTPPSMSGANSAEQRPARAFTAMPPENAAAKVPVETVENVFICGAATKKGTPCSRRVKGNFRCWQHAGQPAMLPPGQLRASR